MDREAVEPGPRWANWSVLALVTLALLLLTAFVGVALGRKWVAVGGALMGPG